MEKEDISKLIEGVEKLQNDDSLEILRMSLMLYGEEKFQLIDYAKKNNYNEGYYLIFQLGNFYNDNSFEEVSIKINQVVINIAPQAPTRALEKR